MGYFKVAVLQRAENAPLAHHCEHKMPFSEYFTMPFFKAGGNTKVCYATVRLTIDNHFILLLCYLLLQIHQNKYMSRVMRKLDFCLCENKGADQFRSDCKAHQSLCFFYMDSTIPFFLNLKFQASSHPLWLHRLVWFGPVQKPRRPV